MDAIFSWKTISASLATWIASGATKGFKAEMNVLHLYTTWIEYAEFYYIKIAPNNINQDVITEGEIIMGTTRYVMKGIEISIDIKNISIS